MKLTPGIFIASFAAVLLGVPGRAATILAIEPPTVSANPGEVGGVFDVVLTNSGPGSITVGSFNFEVSVAGTDITLTGADSSTVAPPYIFAGHSVDADISIPLNFTSGQTLDANDTYDVPGSGVTLTAGESLALGELFFNASPTAAFGGITVSFTGGAAANNLSDPAGDIIAINTFSGGTINITSAPEPSSFLLMLAGTAAIAAWNRRRRA
jgi:hypothetical protein